jgi:hypothetical protein
MNSKNRLTAIPIIVVLALTLSWPVIATAAEFSADMIMSGGGDEETGKVFIKGRLHRMELMEDGKLAAINISRPDKGVNWNLMPDEKMYMEMPLTEIGYEDIESLESKTTMTVLGNETVNGYKCEKRRYESNDKTEGPVIVWFSPKLGYPVKILTLAYGGEGDMTLEYRNIKIGKVPDSIFEVPKGYKKFAIPGMPAGMPGGMPKVPGMGK